ncbi:hypothetical protein [Pseudonocardia sp. ICBG601]|nr:hypothetical protein [Pseudonocardia sp. ICBG601]
MLRAGVSAAGGVPGTAHAAASPVNHDGVPPDSAASGDDDT